MATLAKTYTFTTGTTAVAAEVNQNFDDIVSFVNSNAIQKDGSLAMTAALTLANAEPSGSNVATRRKSAYRGCLNAHPSADVFTVGGGAAAALTTMSTITDPFGYTPDYIYSMLVLCTGTVFLSGNSGLGHLCVTDSADAVINIFGPAGDGCHVMMAGNNNSYEAFSFVALKQNIAAGTVPSFKTKYRVAGLTTMSVWGVSMVYILPQTRQLPN